MLIVFIQENILKFKAEQLSRFEFVKRMVFKPQLIGEKENRLV